MKLSELRSAMRKVKGNPSVVVELVAGVPLTLVLQKTPLMEELGRAYNDERTAETGLTFDEDTGIMSGPLSAVVDDRQPELPFDGDDDDFGADEASEDDLL